jgi:hypothetical protein
MKAVANHRFSYPNPSTSRRSFLAFSAGGLLTFSAVGRLNALASQGSYEPGKKIEGDYSFEYGTYVAPADDKYYQYATGADGYAYYTTYDGSSWSEWASGGEQKVKYDPAPVSYDGKSHAYYAGDDGYIYEFGWDTYGDPKWENVSGEYTFDAAPYATTYEDSVYLYGASTDGYVYHKAYSKDAGWGEWEPLNDAEYPVKADAKPYSVSWGDYENTFWTGEDGYAYWNRYDYAAGTWTGAKQIPSDYTFKGTPYAIGYAPEKSLYAYAVTADGAPAYNTFDGEGWSGWEAWDTGWTGTYQPNAYYYNDYQHVVYTSDDYHAYYTWYGADGWSEWEDLGENYGYDTYQYEYDDSLYLTYTGEDGGIYYRTYAADGGATTDPDPTEEPDY